MQVCNKCKQEKDWGEFHWEKKGVKRSKRCKSCQKELSSSHYKRNSDDYKNNRNSYRTRNKRYIFEYLKTHHCVSCGESDPVVLEFDHRDPTKKEFNISSSPSRRVSLKKLQEEIDKCDVLCANCHRRKTAKDNDHYCYVYLQEENIPR